MMRAISMLVLAGVLACAPALASEIYRTTDDEGNVVYTDDPPSDDAEPVELDPLTTVPGTPTDDEGETDAEQDDDGASQPDRDGLSGIRITYPENDKAIRHNGGNVPFRVELEPEGASLPQGHQVEIVLDGEARARAPGTQIVVSPVNRGPHTVRARVVDARGEPRFESGPVKFFLLRKALGGDN